MSKIEADPEIGAAVEKAVVVGISVAQKKVAEEEDPRLRWAFVRKVYSILALQFIFTAGIAGVACLVHPIPRFFLTFSVASWSVYIAILLAPFVVMWRMLKYRQKHPVNLVLLALYTFCISLTVAVVSSTVAALHSNGKGWRDYLWLLRHRAVLCLHRLRHQHAGEAPHLQ